MKLSFDSKQECNKNANFVNTDNIDTVLPAVFYKKDLHKITNTIQESHSDSSYTAYPIYQFNYSDTIKSTLNYLFHFIGVGIYVKIKNNQIQHFIPFNNMEYHNPLYNNIKLPKQFKSTKEYFDYKNKIHPIRKNN